MLRDYFQALQVKRRGEQEWSEGIKALKLTSFFCTADAATWQNAPMFHDSQKSLPLLRRRPMKAGLNVTMASGKKMTALRIHRKSEISRNVPSSANSSGPMGLFQDNGRHVTYEGCRQMWFIGVLSNREDKPISSWQPFFKRESCNKREGKEGTMGAVSWFLGPPEVAICASEISASRNNRCEIITVVLMVW